MLFNGDHGGSVSVLAEGGVLHLALGIAAFEFGENGLSKHSFSLTVNEDNTLFALVLVEIHHFTELVELVVEHFSMAHTVHIVQQFVDVKVYLDNSVLHLGFLLVLV